MEYVSLGRTGLRVSRAGFGGGGIGQVWGPTTVEESVSAIHRALELGINFFDVAPGYGNGKAEEGTGHRPGGTPGRGGGSDQGAASSRPDGRRSRGRGALGGEQSSPAADGFSRRSPCTQPVHGTARRSHRLPFGGRRPGSGSRRLPANARDGQDPVHRHIRRWTTTYPAMQRILESGKYDTVLAYYNLLNTTAQDPAPPGASVIDQGQIIPLARSQNMGVIGIRSHAAGALTPQVDRDVAPGTLLAQDLASAQTLDLLTDGPIKTLSQAAMVFSMMNRDIHTTVPGVKNVAEIEEIAACADLPPIPAGHLARLRDLYEKGFRE